MNRPRGNPFGDSNSASGGGGGPSRNNQLTLAAADVTDEAKIKKALAAMLIEDIDASQLRQDEKQQTLKTLMESGNQDIQDKLKLMKKMLISKVEFIQRFTNSPNQLPQRGTPEEILHAMDLSTFIRVFHLDEADEQRLQVALRNQAADYRNANDRNHIIAELEDLSNQTIDQVRTTLRTWLDWTPAASALAFGGIAAFGSPVMPLVMSSVAQPMCQSLEWNPNMFSQGQSFPEQDPGQILTNLPRFLVIPFNFWVRKIWNPAVTSSQYVVNLGYRYKSLVITVFFLYFVYDKLIPNKYKAGFLRVLKWAFTQILRALQMGGEASIYIINNTVLIVGKILQIIFSDVTTTIFGTYGITNALGSGLSLLRKGMEDLFDTIYSAIFSIQESTDDNRANTEASIQNIAANPATGVAVQCDTASGEGGIQSASASGGGGGGEQQSNTAEIAALIATMETLIPEFSSDSNSSLPDVSQNITDDNTHSTAEQISLQIGLTAPVFGGQADPNLQETSRKIGGAIMSDESVSSDVKEQLTQTGQSISRNGSQNPNPDAQAIETGLGQAYDDLYPQGEPSQKRQKDSDSDNLGGGRHKSKRSRNKRQTKKKRPIRRRQRRQTKRRQRRYTKRRVLRKRR